MDQDGSYGNCGSYHSSPTTVSVKESENGCGSYNSISISASGSGSGSGIEGMDVEGGEENRGVTKVPSYSFLQGSYPCTVVKDRYM